MGTMEKILIGLLVLPLIAIVLGVGVIFRKAGYPLGRSLLMAALSIIPPVAFIVLLYLAFNEWPLHRELRELKAKPPAA